jgi:DNA processing protein
VSGSSNASHSPDSRLLTRRDALALTLAEGVGAVGYHELLATFGSASQALASEPFVNESGNLRSRAERAMRDAEHIGARMILHGDDDYPPRLLHLTDPPPVLWLVGDERMLEPPVVSIVGTRNATAYGERVTREIAHALARAGACVMSGMARGIDGEAHRAALDAGGRTVAVLGTGVDIAYPAAHRHLHRTIASRGLLVSELPCGDRAHKGSFPRRNRIIAALADVTIVVEAGSSSGAKITADHALDLGRTLAAVPGQIDMPQAAGCNLLLRDGAHVIASVADALALAGLTAPRERPMTLTSNAEQRVWDALSSGALDMDALCAAVALPARDCIAAVGAMELRGIVDCELTGEIRRR